MAYIFFVHVPVSSCPRALKFSLLDHLQGLLLTFEDNQHDRSLDGSFGDSPLLVGHVCICAVKHLRKACLKAPECLYLILQTFTTIIYDLVI